MVVVDNMLCFIGIAGSRVVDTLIVPRIVNGNTNSLAIMKGEKITAIIKNG